MSYHYTSSSYDLDSDEYMLSAYHFPRRSSKTSSLSGSCVSGIHELLETGSHSPPIDRYTRKVDQITSEDAKVSSPDYKRPCISYWSNRYVFVYNL